MIEAVCDPVYERRVISMEEEELARSLVKLSLPVGVGAGVRPQWRRVLGPEAAEAACKRMRHAVEPFVEGVMAQAHWAEAVTPERGEPGHKRLSRARRRWGDWESHNAS